MTDNEIMSALWYCNGGDCEDCKALGKCHADWTFLRDAHHLINRQKAEIDRVKEANAGLALSLLYGVVNDDPMLREEIIAVAKKEAIREFAENLKLKADKESVRELVNYGNYWGRTMKIPEDSKAYAISYKISEVDLDDLVKEMTEDENKE